MKRASKHQTVVLTKRILNIVTKGDRFPSELEREVRETLDLAFQEEFRKEFSRSQTVFSVIGCYTLYFALCAFSYINELGPKMPNSLLEGLNPLNHQWAAMFTALVAASIVAFKFHPPE